MCIKGRLEMARESQFTEGIKREASGAEAEAKQNVSFTARALGISNKMLHARLKQFGQSQVVDVKMVTMSERTARIRQLERAVEDKDATIKVVKSYLDWRPGQTEQYVMIAQTQKGRWVR
jgi:hypothetical protein